MAFGFFDLDTIQKATYEGHVEPTPLRASTCATCGQYKKCTSSQLPAIGLGEKKILIITGAVTRAEDEDGNKRHGDRYNYLKKHFRFCGIDIEKDCWYTHAIRCYFKGRSSAGMVASCHNKLMEEIKELRPSQIFVIDQLAWEVLLHDRLGGRASYSSHYDWCGEVIPDQKLHCWVTPIYDPTLVAKEDEKNVNKYHLFWHQHISNIQTTPPIRFNLESKCIVAETMERAMACLDEIATWDTFAFDYETSGLKPFMDGHDIWYVSFSNGEKSFSFPMFKNMNFRQRIVDILEHNATKIAHNMSFEMMWSEQILGAKLGGVLHDTALMQHCVHNKKPVGLKFLSYAQYGLLGHDREIDEYLSADEKNKKKYGDNAINRIADAPAKKTMLYCAMDSLLTYWLHEDLYQRLQATGCDVGYKFFMEAQKALYGATMTGMGLDEAKMKEHEEHLTSLLDPLYKEIMNHDAVVKQWDGGYKFNPKSDHDVRILLYKILKYPVVKYTDKGEPSVDEEALAVYKNKCSLVPPLLEYRRWSKALNTYIGQYKRENNNGTLHAFYKLAGVQTYRSGCGSPNLQNTPIRDKEVMIVIRSLLKPKRGHKLIEYDYKANEVGGAASISGDPALIRYVSDPTTDMHKDISVTLFKLEPEKVNKALRNVTKGPFVFATFYGSYWKQTAKGVWDGINIQNAVRVFGLDVIKHLKSKGISSYVEWEEHVKEQERNLWQVRFPVYQEWRESTFDFFMKHGYVDYPNGFRYYGPATRNEVLNAPIQGPSFHCQLWSFTQVAKELEKKKMESCLVGQVHDSILASVHPAEEDWMDRMVYEYGTQKVKEHYKWIQVPLMIEKAVTEVDAPWSTKKDVGFLRG